MKCPHCHDDLPSRECPTCNESIPVFGSFCCYCGKALPDLNETGMELDEEEGDFSNRILCSDGNCIGVINEQGVCGVCGKPYGGEGE